MMNSLLKKRLPGILVVGLVALAVGAAGAAPATASDASTSDASASALTGKQKRAKKRALRKCNRKRGATKRRTVQKRRACKRQVRKRFRRISKRQNQPKGKTWRVDVTDPYAYIPNQLSIKVNDSIIWDWRNAGGREPHDVTPTSVPAGVNRYDFKSTLTADPTYKFKRKFVKAGNYSFVCSIHTQMTMNVRVRR